MQRARQYITYILLLLILFALGGLGGWYYFLRIKEKTITTESTGRGLGITEPITSQTGSTYSNIAQSSGGNQSALAQNGATTSGPGGGNTFGTSLGSLSQSGFSSGTTSTIGAIAPSLPIANKPATPRLWHAVKNPVAGYGFVGTGTSTKLYFAERATGYVFSLDVRQGSTLRLTNTLTPKTYEALFADDGSVIERSIVDDAVRTFAGVVGTTTSGTTATLTGIELERNISALAIDSAHKTIIYTKTSSVGTTVYSVQWDGKKRTSLFSTKVGSWRPIALGNGRVVISLKAADGIPGYAYEIQKDGSLKTIARAVPGLNVLPQNNPDALLFSTSAGAPALYALVNGSSTPQLIDTRTIIDKCVWQPAPPAPKKSTVAPPSLLAYCAVPVTTPSGNYLDAWYQGRAHTEDVWWSIDVKNNVTKVVADARDAGAELSDVQDPVIDLSGSYIAYKDARDDSLWVMRINQ